MADPSSAMTMGNAHDPSPLRHRSALRRLRGQRRDDARTGRRTCAPASRRSGQGGGEVRARAPPRARQAAAARSRRGTDRSRFAVPRAVAARRVRPLRRRGPRRRHRHRHRPRLRARVRHRRQRRHGEGRHLLPDHREEAPARAGDRAAEPPALHLPGRFRRRLPADAGRDLPRPRPLRPHLLQPGEPVGAGHSADRRGDGLLHRRRRLCAGDERRDDHRAQAGHHLPGRPAAGAGCHRRDRQRRGSGRRRCARAHLRRGRPLRA